ncbi:TPA: hypothetical protein ACH3X3_003655 [Trebouxia sp. C0006]
MIFSSVKALCRYTQRQAPLCRSFLGRSPSGIRLPLQHLQTRHQACPGRVVGPNSKPAPHCLVQQQGPDFSLLAPRLRQEWDSEKNQHIGNVQVKPYSSKVLAWICPEGTADDPHCWDARVYSRTRGTAVHTVLESK